jgi:hypothetical protein
MGAWRVRFGSFLTKLRCPNHVWFTPVTTELRTSLVVRFVPIVLQKSQNAVRLISR